MHEFGYVFGKTETEAREVQFALSHLNSLYAVLSALRLQLETVNIKMFQWISPIN